VCIFDVRSAVARVISGHIGEEDVRVHRTGRILEETSCGVLVGNNMSAWSVCTPVWVEWDEIQGDHRSRAAVGIWGEKDGEALFRLTVGTSCIPAPRRRLDNPDTYAMRPPDSILPARHPRSPTVSAHGSVKIPCASWISNNLGADLERKFAGCSA
jgi:hypothetical protein